MNPKVPNRKGSEQAKSYWKNKTLLRYHFLKKTPGRETSGQVLFKNLVTLIRWMQCHYTKRAGFQGQANQITI
jgi:hypothetical protein